MSWTASALGRAATGLLLLGSVCFFPAARALAAATPGWGTNLQTHAVDAPDLGTGGVNVSTVRVGMRWGTVEPVAPVGGVHRYNTLASDWASTDARVAAATGIDGMQVLGVVGNPPAWAMVGSTYGVLPGMDFNQDYADYFLAVIQRYSAPPYNVRHFEITNEPDLDVTAANVTARAAAYADILKKVWTTTAAFRATPVGSQVRLVGMVLSHSPVSLAPGSTQSNKFFNQIWDDPVLYDGTLLRDKFHILSFHTYTGYFAPEIGNPAGIGQLWEQALQPTFNRVAGIKPLWITEAGYSSGNDGKGIAAPENTTGTQTDPEGWQARYLVRMATIIRGSGGIDRFLQFNLYSGAGATGEEQWGLVRTDGTTHKPAWDAYRYLTTVLDDSVISLSQAAYSRTGATACVYSYSKITGYYGWVTWHVPFGATMPVELGGGAIPAHARIFARQMLDTAWTEIANPGTGSVTITATNTPQYIEVRLPELKQPPRWPSASFAKNAAVVGLAYAGSLADEATDPDAGALVFTKLDGPAWFTVAPDGAFTGTPTPADLGINVFIIQASDAFGNASPVALQIAVLADAPDNPPATQTFISIAAEDGYVQESALGSGVGGNTLAGGTATAAIRAGDDATKTQFKSIVSFDTSPLADAMVVDAATLRLNRGTVVGQNPYTWGGPALVDLKKGGFNGNTALEVADFQAAADQTGAGVLSPALNNLDWAEAPLTAGLNYINTTGTTQLRIRFSTPTNNNATADYMGWVSREFADATRWPQLVIASRKGNAGILLSNLAQSYDGTPKAATVTTTPAGLGVSVTYDGSPVPPVHVGFYDVTATVTDPNYIGTATGLLGIVDTTPPVLALPANLILEATEPGGAIATFTATATDDVDGNLPVALNPASGGVFPFGTTVVNATATDAAGNTATGSLTVTVRDTTPPVFQALTASPATLWPANHKLVAVTLTAGGVDAGDPAPVTHIVGVACNEPVNGPGDSNTAPDWAITGPLTLNLRAERAGNGPGRVYTITVESRDQAGNAATQTVAITVPHNR